MKLKDKAKEEFIVGLWELVHGYQVKDNCGIFAVYNISTSVCSREKEEWSRVLRCSGNGGRAYMDVSAAKSDVINVVVA